MRGRSSPARRARKFPRKSEVRFGPLTWASSAMRAGTPPYKRPITKPIVLLCSQLVMNNGFQETLTQLRTKFWIAKSCQVGKKIISTCIACKKIDNMAFYLPRLPHRFHSPMSPPSLQSGRITLRSITCQRHLYQQRNQQSLYSPLPACQYPSSTPRIVLTVTASLFAHFQVIRSKSNSCRNFTR